jgi:hypothetical protein
VTVQQALLSTSSSVTKHLPEFSVLPTGSHVLEKEKGREENESKC